MVKDDGIFRPDGSSVKPILPAYRQVADQLLSLIIDGEVKPGERLPTEETLAKTFAVSRSTIREALRSLAVESFIETSRGPTGG
ncbi:MAG: winged helix-turn-helix domain-containing protein, partial [bacterium]